MSFETIFSGGVTSEIDPSEGEARAIRVWLPRLQTTNVDSYYILSHAILGSLYAINDSP